MKKTILILACGMSFLTGFSQELPKWANKAKKAVFSVITYNKDNQILNTGNGFYIDEQLFPTTVCLKEPTMQSLLPLMVKNYL